MLSVSPSPRDRRYTVLVSDDDPGVRRGLLLLLRARGYAVSGYTTGSALLADPRAREADCVILDYRMPDIDGLTLLDHLRRQGWRGDAILISGFYDEDLEQRARAAGFDQVIAKPVIGRAVLEALRRRSAMAREAH
jgi:FixJ family two-component response regulator